jgi:hypothetical protein
VTTRFAAVVAAALVAGVAAAGDPSPTDDAARRAAIAKLGRLAFCERGKPLTFCDLDGANPTTTDVLGVSIRVLPDRRRVLCSGDGRVRVVEIATGAAVDLTADAPDDDFCALTPAVSPDGRFAVYWHGPKRPNLPQDPTAFAVFDLDAGTRRDVGDMKFQDVRRPFQLDDPTAWWSDDGTLYACVGAKKEDGDKDGERWKLIRWSPRDGKTETFAELPWGTRVRFAAFRGGRAAYAVEPQQNFRFMPQVRGGDGRVLFERLCYVWGVDWEADGQAVRLRCNSPDSPPVTSFWRVVPGETPTEIDEFAPPARAEVPGGFVEERPIARAGPVVRRRPASEPEHELFRVTSATGESVRIGPGRAPRRIGDVVVFWRVTVPARVKEGRYFESPPVIPGTDDLWAYDPKDGATIRLSDRGFWTHAWDIVPAQGK